MKALFLIFSITLLLPSLVIGQGCNGLIAKAQTLIKNRRFDEAIVKIEAAKGCATQADIDKLYADVFVGLEQQNQEAIAAQLKAVNAENAIKVTLKALKIEKENAIAEKTKAEAAKRRATAVLDKIYFYDDKLGLSYDKNSKDGHGAYGFIDKNLKTKIAFIYDEAKYFDYTGFAKVKRDSIEYLIDSLGNEYKLATDIKQLDTSITALDLSYKNLTSIPPSVFNQKQLKLLRLSNNNIATLSDSIAQLNKLLFLILDLNQIESIPAELSQWTTNIQSLNMSGNQIDSIPKELSQWTSIQSLNLSGNQIESIPAELSQWTNIQSLDLSGNQIKSIPAELSQWKSIQSLNLNENQITSIPAKLSQWKSIQSLNLSENQITSIPAELSQWKSVQSLNLSGNHLRSIPSALSQWKSIQSLNLSFNEIESIPIELSQWTSIQSLNLSGNQLTTIPVELSQWKNIQSLNLSENQITIFPPELSQWKNIQSLYLSSNQLTSIPTALGNLISIQTLDLSSNQLTYIPASLSQLTSIQSLDLSKNKINELPSTFCIFKDLEGFVFSGNPMYKVPNCLLPQLMKMKADSARTVGIKLFRDSNYIEAYKAILLSTQLDTTDAQKYGDLSYSALFARQYPKAIEATQKTLQLQPQKVHYVVLLAMGYLLNDEFDKAEIIFTNWKGKKFVEFNDEMADIIFLREIKKIEGTGIYHKDFERVRQLFPAEYAYQKALDFFKDSNYLEAYKSVLLSTQLDTTDYIKYLSLSFYGLFVNEYTQAIEAAHKTLQLNPKAVSVETKLALAYLLNNEYDKAEVIYKKWKGKVFSYYADIGDEDNPNQTFLQDITTLEAAGIHHKDFDRVRKLLMMPADYVHQAEKFFADSNYAEAYKNILLSTELDTNDFRKYRLLSRYALFVGEYDKSIAAIQKILQLYPQAVSVETNLALAHLLNNQYDKAEIIYKKWKGKTLPDGEDAEPKFLRDIEELETARIHHKDFERVRNLFPYDSAYHTANKFFTDSNYAEAYKAIVLSTQSDTTDYRKYNNLSFYALFVGEYTTAIAAAHKALQLNPEYVSVEAKLALAYLLNNQYDKAETIYKKWKGKMFSDAVEYMADDVFLDDIDALKAAGIRHKDFDRVEKLLLD